MSKLEVFKPEGNWKQIPSFPDYYVSEDGQIWSTFSNKTLRFRFRNKYLNCYLQNPAKKVVTKRVQHVVAEAFIGPRPPGMLVCHNDGNHLNNHYTNLRYDTPKGNMLDKIKHGTCPSGSKHWCSKLSPEDVVYIRQNYKRTSYSKSNGRELAKMFGVTTKTISDVVSRKRYKS